MLMNTTRLPLGGDLRCVVGLQGQAKLVAVLGDHLADLDGADQGGVTGGAGGLGRARALRA
jgi:hypothetical protein